jgi:hypothetical protein
MEGFLEYYSQGLVIETCTWNELDVHPWNYCSYDVAKSLGMFLKFNNLTYCMVVIDNDSLLDQTLVRLL